MAGRARPQDMRINSAAQAREAASTWLSEQGFAHLNTLADKAAELDARRWVWRVALIDTETRANLGEIVVDSRTGTALAGQSTDPEMLRRRLATLQGDPDQTENPLSTVVVRYDLPGRNSLWVGDCEAALARFEPESVQLVFTSPPYFNARDYVQYLDYQGYLDKMRRVFRACHRALGEGRFIAVNSSPVLVRRAHRKDQSRRLAVPFDLHRILVEEGFDFMEDIVWEKPESAGWATLRGRKFTATRHPLAYKAAPVTEYILVYRKHTDRLIDWNIRSQSPETLSASRVGDGYERTNVWRIKPAHDPRHPAIFPLELARKVIAYYSFAGDVVLDPFAGIGTTGQAAAQLGRRWALIEQAPEYAAVIRSESPSW